MIITGEKLYIGCIILAVVVLVGFLLHYYIKKTVHDEIVRIKKRGMKRGRRMTRPSSSEGEANMEEKQIEATRRRMAEVGDMDSYIDPMEERREDYE